MDLDRTLSAVIAGVRTGLLGLVRPGPDGRRAAEGAHDWPDGALLFHEYFDGDTGAGLGAGHHTWRTALLADLILRP